MRALASYQYGTSRARDSGDHRSLQEENWRSDSKQRHAKVLDYGLLCFKRPLQINLRHMYDSGDVCPSHNWDLVLIMDYARDTRKWAKE